MPMPTSDLASGAPYPLGATPLAGGVNFSVFADKADAVELLLFDGVDDPRRRRCSGLIRRQHRTYHYWHVFVPGVQAGQIYAYRAIGPYAPEQGLRYDADKVLLDPYGRCVAVPTVLQPGSGQPARRQRGHGHEECRGG